jgi:hypothetical protein
MSSEPSSDDAVAVPNIKFVARKVRMANEYYVEASAPGRLTHRIGPFKLRASAKQWIRDQRTRWLLESGKLL